MHDTAKPGTCWSPHPEFDWAYDTAERLWVELLDPNLHDTDDRDTEWSVYERKAYPLHLAMLPSNTDLLDYLIGGTEMYAGGEAAESGLAEAVKAREVLEAAESLIELVGFTAELRMAATGLVVPWPYNDSDANPVRHRRITLGAGGAPLLDGRPMGPFPDPTPCDCGHVMCPECGDGGTPRADGGPPTLRF